jgi:hypothetical protein
MGVLVSASARPTRYVVRGTAKDRRRYWPIHHLHCGLGPRQYRAPLLPRVLNRRDTPAIECLKCSPAVPLFPKYAGETPRLPATCIVNTSSTRLAPCDLQINLSLKSFLVELTDIAAYKSWPNHSPARQIPYEQA